MIYYYEAENGCGKFKAPNDETAKSKIERRNDIWVLYRESQKTPDGIPFVILYERQ